MNLKKITITLLILILGLLLMYFAVAFYIKINNSKFENNKVKKIHSEEESVEFSDLYFVPVSKFTNAKTYYSLDELQDEDLVTFTQNFDFLPDLIKDQVAKIEIMEIGEALQEDKIAILTIDQVKPIYKTLYIDHQNIWTKEFDAESYPLKKHIEKSKVEEFQILNHENISTLFAGGEIIPARAVDRLGLNKYNDYTYLFDFFREDIETADISIALLENSLLGDPAPCTGCMIFQGDDKVAKGLAEVGFDFISLAGNHAGDAGQKAYENTIDLMEKNNIEYTGTGEIDTVVAPSKDINVALKDIEGFRYGMIGADDVASYYWIPSWPWNFEISTDTRLPVPIDTNERYGTYTFSKRVNGRLAVDQKNVKAIKRLKNLKPVHGYEVDYSIVYMSWGVEYTNKPTEHQVELAHELVDNGADLIIGSHPHWVQSIEFYKDVPIIYSLGNFIFDQTHELETRQGMVVNLHYYQNKLKSIELIPHQICGYHQTSMDITKEYLEEKLSLEDVYNADEKEGCIYWQPKKLKQTHKSYEQILNRVFEHTDI